MGVHSCLCGTFGGGSTGLRQQKGAAALLKVGLSRSGTGSRAAGHVSHRLSLSSSLLVLQVRSGCGSSSAQATGRALDMVVE